MSDRNPAIAPLVIVGKKAVALDRTTGAILWEYPAPEVFQRFLIEGTRIFLCDLNGTVHCLDLSTGSVLGVVYTRMRGACALISDGRQLYVGSATGTVVAIDLAGRERWRTQTEVRAESGLVGLGLSESQQQPDYSRD